MVQKTVKDMIAPLFIDSPDPSKASSSVKIGKWALCMMSSMARRNHGKCWALNLLAATCSLLPKHGAETCQIGEVQSNKSGSGPYWAAKADQKYCP